MAVPFHEFFNNLNIVFLGLFLRFSLIHFPSLVLIKFFSRLVGVGLIIILLKLTLLSVALSCLHVNCPDL